MAEEKREGRSNVELKVAKSQAVVLEAASFTTEQIANLVGVSVPSVKRWRRDDEYRRQVAEASERHIEDIHPLIERLKADLAGAATEAVKVLLAAMQKQDSDGFPHRNAIDAARTALANVRIATGDGSEGGASATAQTAVIVVDGKEVREAPKKVDAETTAIEAPD